MHVSAQRTLPFDQLSVDLYCTVRGARFQQSGAELQHARVKIPFVALRFCQSHSLLSQAPSTAQSLWSLMATTSQIQMRGAAFALLEASGFQFASVCRFEAACGSSLAVWPGLSSANTIEGAFPGLSSGRASTCATPHAPSLMDFPLPHQRCTQGKLQPDKRMEVFKRSKSLSEPAGALSANLRPSFHLPTQAPIAASNAEDGLSPSGAGAAAFASQKERIRLPNKYAVKWLRAWAISRDGQIHGMMLHPPSV